MGQIRLWDGSALRPRLARELILEGERLALIERQLAELKAEREALVASSPCKIAGTARALRELGGIAEESSFVFSTEVLGWRTFANRRELAGALGVTGTPFNSGNCEREQGISKAGNKRMRAMLIEIAWCWLRYQPESALEPVVAGPVCARQQAHAPDRHRGAGAQAAGGAVALPGGGPGAGGCHPQGAEGAGGMTGASARPMQPGAVLALVKAKPFGWPCGPALTRAARGARDEKRSGRRNARGAGRTKEWTF